MNKVKSLVLIILIAISCTEDNAVRIPKAPDEVDLTSAFYYRINLKDRSNDTFKVELIVDELTAANSIIQFPATAPGTYDILDFGRFVTSFRAFDEGLTEIPVDHPSTNQWVLSDPENTYLIKYEIAETFDTPVDVHPIYKMAGTSIENDHTLLNAFAVLAYPTGLKERDFYLDVVAPSGWTSGSSLPKTTSGLYLAPNYDFLVDNPLLFGEMTTSTTSIGGATIGVHTYSKSKAIASSQILNDIQQILTDANEFLDGLPVGQYNFLFVFDDFNAGALEHSYSSVYVLNDQPYSTGYGTVLRHLTSHEFFHIVTPLNIHSEIIEDFNFAVPTPSQHLWLYEGVTEWASYTMRYRNQSITLEDLLYQFSGKINYAKSPSLNYSLTQLSSDCYTSEGGAQFNNVYNKGAMVAALLDIRLLELSNGLKGLREVILELIDTFGPNNSFSETEFFDYLVSITYPEVEVFINSYIKGTDALPYVEYFAKLGITFDPATNLFTVNESPTVDQQFLRTKWSINF
jgi:predicted metalloprotease with PDZ domain